MSRDVSELEPVIRSIFLDPSTNLRTVSTKVVRQQLLEAVPFIANELVQPKRSQVDETIVRVFYQASALLGGEAYAS